ncbi:MAG: hypothetical protein KDA42_08550 [Planctomycetales bacterium]|nr:hypothetical protein [Planctomycetales bacterium]
MSTAEWNVNVGTGAGSLPPVNGAPKKRLHRVHTVRVQQGISIRSAARRMKSTVLEAESLEAESSNMLLSTLYKWAEALEVPVSDLLVEEEDGVLSEPVLRRARMVRIMKTAGSILEKSPNDAIRRLASMMIEQLVELMPELREVSPWHSVGQRRSSEEQGRLAENPIPDEFFGGASW